MPSAPRAAVEPREDQHDDRSWDVTHGPRKETALERFSMVLPAVTRVATNVVGGALVGGGYAMGKVGERFTGCKAVDSASFRSGVQSWMWSNGIVPSVVYEPLGEAGARAASWYGTEAAGAEDVRQAPLLVSNHTSYLDGLVLAACLGFPRVVAMAGTRKVPIVGRLMEDMDCVFVDRSSSDSRQATLEAIGQHCASWAPGGRPMLIFPEGTTSNGQGILPFRRGAFAAGAPVRPVLLVYTGQWDPASTTWRATENGLKELSDAEWAAQFAGTWVHSVHVRVLAPYVPSLEEQRDPALYAQNCHAHMATALARVRLEVQVRGTRAELPQKLMRMPCPPLRLEPSARGRLLRTDNRRGLTRGI
mmetsp:Transcript_48055/g.128152  ORF Transcript_48055/g.128152 Transcript_48055/m.128152 type:complete len:362 (+) Transcript_48055:84-1169(+)